MVNICRITNLIVALNNDESTIWTTSTDVKFDLESFFKISSVETQGTSLKLRSDALYVVDVPFVIRVCDDVRTIKFSITSRKAKPKCIHSGQTESTFKYLVTFAMIPNHASNSKMCFLEVCF